MSKFQELQRELRYADQAKVSTAQLKQRLNDIIARTADADVTYSVGSENIYKSTSNIYHPSGFLGNTWIHQNFAYVPTPRAIKTTKNPLTGKTQTQYDPFGRKQWWGSEGWMNVSPNPFHSYPNNFPFFGITVSTVPDLNPYHQRKASATSTRENLISELMNSKEFKDVQYLTNLRIVPDERKRKFRPRMYDVSSNLTVKSDPRLLVNMVNNLKNAMKKRGGTSSAPVGRSGSDFFANILRRGEG